MYFVYIMTNKENGTLYIGMSGELVKRVYQHREGLIEGFTKRYSLHKLVYYEGTPDVAEAIRREKQMKKWNRQWKLRLINSFNPDWRDLWDDIAGESRT